ncbi:MAG: 4Fe-4S binding protein [Leptospirales bacterium]|nr:4Fe-4S binding protein [Leptospirales bacterium]
MLKKIRLIFSILVFCAINLFFLNKFDAAAGLTKIQLVTAAISLNILVLLFLFVMTLLFGRLYCSFICPLGIFQDIAIWLSKKTSRLQKTFSFSKPRNIVRYVVLAATLLSLFTSLSAIIALVDPYSQYGRMATHIFKPIWIFAFNALSVISDKFELYIIVRKEIPALNLISLGVSITFFAAIGFIAWRYGRAWCNIVCPAGSFLGIISRFSALKISIDKEKCGNCGLCEKICKASCIASNDHEFNYIDYSRCVVCFDCINACANRKAISFVPVLGGFKKQKPSESGAASFSAFSRRDFISTGATVFTGLAAWMLKANPLLAAVAAKKTKVPAAPPGAGTFKRFSKLCTSCHLCVSQCPEQVLRPSTTEYGILGIMQPVMNFSKGGCDYSCAVCGQVCPTGAIQNLPLAERQKIRIGYAVFNSADCLIIKDNIKCKNCTSHCPVDAIKLEENNGKNLPVVDKDKCIGCGQCEYYCPARPEKAIYVEGYAEQR